MNLIKTKLSKRVKKELIFPKIISVDLAYICGFMAGDGSIYTSTSKHDYIIKCVGDPKKERDYYHKTIGPLFKELFNLDVNLKVQDCGETYGFVVYSKELLTYLTENIGLPCGKKYDSLRIPLIIKNNKKFLKTAKSSSGL